MPDDEVIEAPCGCRLYTVGNTIVLEPCDEECPNYLYALNAAKERDKPITYLEM